MTINQGNNRIQERILAMIMGEKTEKNPRGAGRKKTGNTERIPIYVSPEKKEKLKKEAKKKNSSLTDLIRSKLF